MDTADIPRADTAHLVRADAIADPDQPPDALVPLLEAAELTAGKARLDLAQIQALLKEAEARTRQAQKITSQMRRQLQVVSADSKRLRSQLSGKRADVARLEKELATQVRASDLRETSLRDELSEARFQALAALDSSAHDRKIWIGVSMSIAAAAILCVTASYWLNNNPEYRSPAAPRQTSPGAGATPSPARSHPSASSDIDSSVSRLDDALSRFRKDVPEVVLRRVRDENAARGVTVCSFEWNRGQPSLLFSRAGDRDINSAITDCADAVNQAARQAFRTSASGQTESAAMSSQSP